MAGEEKFKHRRDGMGYPLDPTEQQREQQEFNQRLEGICSQIELHPEHAMRKYERLARS